jgi:hypothetical protein
MSKEIQDLIDGFTIENIINIGGRGSQENLVSVRVLPLDLRHEVLEKREDKYGTAHWINLNARLYSETASERAKRKYRLSKKIKAGEAIDESKEPKVAKPISEAARLLLSDRRLILNELRAARRLNNIVS